jgi:2-C-methyl-D-erythritol 2,4-cyclodiphosphate synthase
MIRIGQGFDIHRLVANKPLIIGGVKIRYDKGLEGHSDGDVLIHAIIDALIGAMALGDIGKFYPDNDSNYKNADSRKLLKNVIEIINKDNIKILNLDSTIIAEEPKLAPYTASMRENISSDIGIEKNCISIKCKTYEKIGSLGRGEGIATLVSLLIEST